MAKKGMTKARHRGFELQSSELWGSKNDLNTQLQFQLIAYEIKSNLFYFFLFKISIVFIFLIFWRLILSRNNRESRAKNDLRIQAIYL